jgi:hypothetical protein
MEDSGRQDPQLRTYVGCCPEANAGLW